MLVNLEDYITTGNFFKWKEALFLPSLGCYHSPTQIEVSNIKATCAKLDLVRAHVGKPFTISCWIRPKSVRDESGLHNGVDYNALPTINGAKSSSHIPGLAVDFKVKGLTIDELMALIKPKLAIFQLAAENNNLNNGRTWCHLQNRILVDGTWRVFDI